MRRRRLQRVQCTQDFAKIATDCHRVRHRELHLLVRPDDEDRANRSAVCGRAPIGQIGVGGQHVKGLGHHQIAVRDNREPGLGLCIAFDIAFPALMLIHPVD